MKYLLALFLLLHGLAHAPGFLKAFGLAQLPQLSQAIPRPLGALWLLTGLMLGLAAGLVVTGGPWWLPALPAAGLSQLLILTSWSDARFGSLPNLLILLLAATAWSSQAFEEQSRRIAETLLAQPPATAAAPSPRHEPLPEPVARWLQRSGAADRPAEHRVVLHQRGEMRTRPDGGWMPFTAEQAFDLDHPGFCWRVRVRALPGVDLLGRDTFSQGRGQMRITAMGLLHLVDRQGPEIDQGARLRYLAEIVWFPAAARSPEIRWQALGPDSARATFGQGDQSVSADFHFSPAGDFLSLNARRYYDHPPAATLETWVISADPGAYRRFDGVRIPARTEVTWRLQQGDFTWLRLSVENLERR